MLLSDLSAVNVLATQLQDIADKLSAAATVQINVKGKPIDAALFAQLQVVGIPVVEAYFASAQAAIVAQLSAYGVTVS